MSTIDSILFGAGLIGMPLIHTGDEAAPWVSAHGAAWLLVATIGVPLLMALACAFAGWRRRVSAWLVVAPLPGLVAAIVARDGAALAVDPSGLEVTLLADGPRALLLGVTSLLWSAAGLYARNAMRLDAHLARFSAAWLLSLAGCSGVFIAGDLGTFYLCFAIVSLAAFAMVIHDGSERARRAASIYLALAIAGEAFLLLGFVLLAYGAAGESLRIAHVVAALPESRVANQTLCFLLLGFGVKVGLVPLHGWLPLAHPAAPAPASAVLSGAIIKTGVVGLILFLPFGGGMAEWGYAVLIVGLITALYGAVIGLTQANPKTVLAYSSVSQMGIVAAILGAGLTLGATTTTIDGPLTDARSVGAFHAAHHALVKGALFLGVGVCAAAAQARWTAISRRVFMAIMALLALSLAGLPLTSGALAKHVAKPLFGDGLVGAVVIASTFTSSLLMLHFLRCLPTTGVADAKSRAGVNAPGLVIGLANGLGNRSDFGLVGPWLATAVASVLVPWLLLAVHAPHIATGAIMPASLWAAIWPIGLAVVAGIILTRLFGELVNRWGVRAPHVPEGDLVCVGERIGRSIYASGAICEMIERPLRNWTVGGVVLMAATLLLGALLWIGTADGTTGFTFGFTFGADEYDARILLPERAPLEPR